MDKFIDLHMHSSYSDGKYDVPTLVNIAEMNNVGIMAITDHDDVNSVEALKKVNSDIKFINGIEISSYFKLNDGVKLIHILGYDYDNTNDELNTVLNEKKRFRYETNREYLINMIKELTFLKESILEDIDCSRYIRFSRLINKYIEENNFTLDEINKVKEYINKVRVCYPGYDFSAEDAIRLIINAKGLPVLAHPYQYRLSRTDEENLIKYLKSLGLVGLEIKHSGDTVEGFKLRKELADKYELLTSIGSDFHTDEDRDEIIEIGYGTNNNLCCNSCTLLDYITGMRK